MNRFLLFLFAAVLFTACSRTSNPTGTPSPVPGDPRYPDQSRRYPDPNPNPNDSRTYPQGYPVEGQTDGVVTIIKTGNNNNGKLPPGQAKKKYGGKSAKVYAPGQQKKNGGNQTGIPTVIAVSDVYASRANTGQLFYVYRSYTYWKQNDGYYYLEDYNNNSNTKGKNKEKHKNKKDKHHDDDEDDD